LMFLNGTFEVRLKQTGLRPDADLSVSDARAAGTTVKLKLRMVRLRRYLNFFHDNRTPLGGRMQLRLGSDAIGVDFLSSNRLSL